jgi:predicted amidohydrolase YtcJ
VDGHAAWVNRKALEIADINSSTPDPPGGKILPGVLIDRAQALVSRHIPPDTPEQTLKRISRAAAECARLGLTTVHDAGVSAAELTAYRTLIAQHKLPVRVYAMIGGDGPLWRERLRRGPEIGDRLTVRSIKLVSDGALGSRGAALLAPYSDDPGNTGLMILQKADIQRVARDAVAHGFQVNTHAIGDRANRTVLEAYATVLKGRNDARFRIEHAQVVALEDIPLFAKYSILASMQSTHATSDMRWAEARVGPERIQGAYAWRRFLALGVPLANGSDFPVEDPNPLWGFYAAITRQDRAGAPPGGWFPDQRLTREEALKSWTLGGAYAAFEEKTKGSLEPGKLADFIMLSRDIMTVPASEILTTRVKMTVVGGEIVYSE